MFVADTSACDITWPPNTPRALAGTQRCFASDLYRLLSSFSTSIASVTFAHSTWGLATSSSMTVDVRLYKTRVAVVLGGISIDDTLQPETLNYPTRVLRESVAHYHTHWPTRRSIGYQNRAVTLVITFNAWRPRTTTISFRRPPMVPTSLTIPNNYH